jgi:hypothetical protein
MQCLPRLLRRLWQLATIPPTQKEYLEKHADKAVYYPSQRKSWANRAYLKYGSLGLDFEHG